MRILVADDDKFFLKLSEEILAEAGYEVLTAQTGKQTLEMAITQMPDLIILDVVLPGMLGTEVSRKLKGFEGTASIPILLVSTGVAELDATAGDPKEFMADDFLAKPFDVKELLERINSLLGSGVAAQSRQQEPGQGQEPEGEH